LNLFFIDLFDLRRNYVARGGGVSIPCAVTHGYKRISTTCPDTGFCGWPL